MCVMEDEGSFGKSKELLFTELSSDFTSYERKVPEPSVPWEGLGTLPAHPGITATDGWFSVSLCAKRGASC